MGDRGDKDEKQIDDVARLPSLLKEWSGVIATFGGAATALLAVLLPGQTSAAVQVIGYAFAAALVVFGAFIFIKVRRRRHSRQLRENRRETWEREAAGAHRTAFRGLFPYQEGDELPGKHRQLEAQRLVTQFSEPTFSFGVVCGDSGCGKTSLLRSAIQSRLEAVGEERGFGILYLSNPRELADDAPPQTDAKDIAARLRSELNRLRSLVDEAARGQSLILIIDQFEEFFIEYSSPELRLDLGRFLNGLIKSNPPVRILCALRRDYLADMKDLASQSPDSADRNFFEPISLQTLFTLKNFTIEQAAKIIKECAERDRVEVEDEFAATLASDLGEGGFVRPPELQIVCTALVDNLTTAEYRLAGGARGILSHYIEDAIAVSGDPAHGRRVLRALCNFPVHAKRTPQTVSEIAEAIGTKDAQASVSIRTALRQFEVARLVVVEKRSKVEIAYTLVHDYLVDAVSKATSDVSTRDEEANQLLDYYVAEYRDDPKTRIPYRRLRFVRKYADPKKLSDPTARCLLRASAIRLATSTVVLATLVAVITTLLVGLITTSRVWHQEIIGSHWERNDSGALRVLVRQKQNIIITGQDIRGDATTFLTYVKLWDTTTGKLVYRAGGDYIRFIQPDYIVSKPDDDEFVEAYHIPTRNRFKPALRYIPGLVKEERFTADPLVQSHSGDTILVGRGHILDVLKMGVFSVAENRELREVRTCSSNSDVYVTKGGDALITKCDGLMPDQPTILYNSTGKGTALLRDGYKSLPGFGVNGSETQVATVEHDSDDKIYVVLWNLRNGGKFENATVLSPPREANPYSNSGYYSFGVRFTEDDSFLYVSEVRRDATFIFRAADLRQMTRVPETCLVYPVVSPDFDEIVQPTFLAWPDVPSGGTYIWNLMEAEPQLIKGLTLPDDQSLIYEKPDNLRFNIAKDRFLVLHRKEGRIELWEWKSGRKIADLAAPSRFEAVRFSLDGEAVRVDHEGGTAGLYDLDTGKKIAELDSIGGSNREIYFDKTCRRVNVWTDEGRVLRYTEGWYLFGRESWFWPAERCEA